MLFIITKIVLFVEKKKRKKEKKHFVDHQDLIIFMRFGTIL